MMTAAYRGYPHLSTHILCLLEIGAGPPLDGVCRGR
jgi:hypothetical protein